MNAQTPVQTLAPLQSATLVAHAGARRPARERARDFGVGYGNSSGYASARRYLGNGPAPRFRCA